MKDDVCLMLKYANSDGGVPVIYGQENILALIKEARKSSECVGEKENEKI